MDVYQAQNISFYLYLPMGAQPPWPVLLFLHGIGEATWNFSNNRWIYQPINAVKAHGSPPELCATRNAGVQALLDSFIVVSPQYPYFPNQNQRPSGQRNWQWSSQVNAINEILDIVINEFGGNRDRIYATGFSRGGSGALGISQRCPISKLVLVDSESFPLALPPIPTWVHYGGQLTLKNIVVAHQPIVNQLGGRFVAVAPNQPAPQRADPLFTDWGHNRGSNIGNHTATCSSAYSDAWIYDWLLR
jgi:predicted esterase